MNKSVFAIAVAAALCAAGSANAAKFKLINDDAPGTGLNDTTPVTPIGGNLGKTRGEQARIVYQFAMDMWGGVLESNSDVNVYASFAPLACTSGSGTLAQAGANWLFNLTDGTKTRRYGSALADALIGFDLHAYLNLDPDDPGDIFSQFNGRLGQPGCLDGMSWYFGLDGNTPAGQTNFLNVVMHELGHGLGVQGFLNKSSGALNGGLSDPYTYYAYDNVLNKPFESMTNAERALAMRTPGRTVWNGANVNYNASLVLDRRAALRPTAPAAIAGKVYEIGYALFGPRATPATFTNRAMVLVNDGDGPSNSDGCSTKGASTTAGDTIAYVNQAEVAGKIAVIDRGTCGFEYKARIAQDNGAAAVIIVNNEVNNITGVLDMGLGAPPTNVSIPTVMVSLKDGNEIKANIASSAAGVFQSNLLAGADASGRTRLYSPSIVAGGSTFSHFDTALSPNALMEPFDTPSVQGQYNVDLTAALFADIGWTLNPGNAKLFNGICDSGVPAVVDGGLVIGANIAATDALCRIDANRTSYYNCMNAHAGKLQSQGLINATQKSKVLGCARRTSDNWGR